MIKSIEVIYDNSTVNSNINYFKANSTSVCGTLFDNLKDHSLIDINEVYDIEAEKILNKYRNAFQELAK